jgi:hypothetical protein
MFLLHYHLCVLRFRWSSTLKENTTDCDSTQTSWNYRVAAAQKVISYLDRTVTSQKHMAHLPCVRVRITGFLPFSKNCNCLLKVNHWIFVPLNPSSETVQTPQITSELRIRAQAEALAWENTS